jgi:TolA-binding protein
MKKIAILVMISTVIVTLSCSSNKSKVEQITKLEKALLETKMTKLDTAKASKLIVMYNDFVTEFPKDSLAPIYLYRAADLNMGLQRGNQAITCLDRIIDNYPKFNKTPDCMFLKGYIAENIMQHLSLAQKFYNQFLKEYPTHAFAKDAEASLKNLGKTPEQLVAEFEANQNKVDSTSKK